MYKFFNFFSPCITWVCVQSWLTECHKEERPYFSRGTPGDTTTLSALLSSSPSKCPRIVLKPPLCFSKTGSSWNQWEIPQFKLLLNDAFAFILICIHTYMNSQINICTYITSNGRHSHTSNRPKFSFWSMATTEAPLAKASLTAAFPDFPKPITCKKILH